MVPVLCANGLRFHYPGRPALSFPDLRLEHGATLGLIGPSGSGKSTLLMLIAGLLDPTEGTVSIDGCDWRDLRLAIRDRVRGAKIGVVLQSFRLLNHLTLLENLTAAQYLSGNGADTGAARTILKELGLADLAQAKPRHLSRGQAQRAAIARAVVNRPRLLLADEPTSSLDDEAATAAMGLLFGITEKLGTALLIATHDTRVKQALPHIVDLRQEAGL